MRQVWPSLVENGEIRRRLAWRLLVRLRNSGLSEVQLAEMSGLPLRLVESYLDGVAKIRIPELRAMCLALDVPIMRFLVRGE